MMANQSDYSLEYSIDTLLKAFNPERKPIMPKSYFFKLMNLLDTRLKENKIDIKLPGYWYKFGFFIDFNYLDIVLPRKFTANYILDENIVPPIHHRSDYCLTPKIKSEIDSAVKSLYSKYGFKKKYGRTAKEDSYKINTPYIFNKTYQDFFQIAENKSSTLFLSRKEQLEPLLDKLLNEFPEEEFPELFDTYLEWDDLTRLFLDYVPEKKTYGMINDFKDRFWDVYSNGVRIRHNQNIPNDTDIKKWSLEYNVSIPQLHTFLSTKRDEILAKNYNPITDKPDTVKKLMQCAYELSGVNK